MRAQLRTYHSIPALQAHQDPNAYKQLQDAPRLKSILKGASEDEPQPGTVDEIKRAAVPRTNPVNLIFVLAQYAPKISEVHFTPPRDFFDLVMRPTLSSKSRAKAFLWLIWWYLESDFSKEDSLRNPFGPGADGEGTGGFPTKVPSLEVLTEEQAAFENLDTEDEKRFGEVKRKERIAILASEPSPAMTALKRARKERSLHTGVTYMASDNEGTMTPSREFRSPVPQSSVYSAAHRDYASSDHTRSPSPPRSGFQAVNLAPKPSGVNISVSDMVEVEDTPSRATPPLEAVQIEKKKGPGRGNWRRNKDKSTPHLEPQPILPNPAQYRFVQASPSVTPSFASFPGPTSPEASFRAGANDNHIPTPSHQTQKRQRPLTQHQVAISEYRRSRIHYILDRGIQKTHSAARRKREQEGAMLRAWKRIKLMTMASGWDSEEEEQRMTKDGEAKGKENDDSGNNPYHDVYHMRSVNSRQGTKGKDSGQRFVHRRANGVWMAGFVQADLQDTDDCGDQAEHFAGVLRRAGDRFGMIDDSMLDEIRVPKMVRRASSVPVKLDVEHEDLSQAVGERPRLARRAGGSGRKGKKAKGKNGTASEKGKKSMDGAGLEEGDLVDDGADGDDMELDDDVEDEAGEADIGEDELDEEDRELLGEVDADESESESDDDEDLPAGDDDIDVEMEERERPISALGITNPYQNGVERSGHGYRNGGDGMDVS